MTNEFVFLGIGIQPDGIECNVTGLKLLVAVGNIAKRQ